MLTLAAIVAWAFVLAVVMALGASVGASMTGNPFGPKDAAGMPLGVHKDTVQNMSLRDWFAGQALANLNLQAHVAKPAAEHMATSAYEIADAMLRERAK